MFSIRRYDPGVERAALLRVWKETGWFPRSDDAKVNTMADFAGETDTWVGTLGESIEAIVVNTNGQVLYDREDLPFTGIMTVAVGRPARKMGVAGKITARLYPRTGNGKQLWVSPLDLKAMPNLFRAVPAADPMADAADFATMGDILGGVMAERIDAHQHGAPYYAPGAGEQRRRIDQVLAARNE